MKKKILFGALGALMMPMALVSCSNSDEPKTGGENDIESKGKFVFATTVQGSNATSYVLLTGESLDEGTLSPVKNGLLNDGATQWVFHKNYLYGLTYNQGNAGTTRSYILGENGEMEARGKEYLISRFSSYGAYDNDILTMATGESTDVVDGNGYHAKMLNVTYLDVVNETSTTNHATSEHQYLMENFLGNGEYVTLAGAEQSGSHLYCGVVPMGLSQYGAAFDNSRWIRKGFEHLVHTEAGGSGSGAYKAGELVGTQYPDECWVAIYDNDDFLNPTLVKTDRISTPSGRYRSQYYQTIWAAENGDIYVFSPSYAKTMTDPLQKTTLNAGVCRIPAGSKKFDDYYFDIESQTGGKSFMRCWPAGGNYFLMVMYDRPLSQSGFAATDLAIFDAASKKLTYVKGLPSNITSLGKTVFTQNGNVYIPVNVENGYPTIYRINPATAQASKGVVIEGASDITGFGYLKPIK
ncbi:MAG: DUF4374 domain-containing protein [Muribaculaceae bacterium]|nr:DUF4374 domain-containing protein [Muribaculaceae bacterium]